MLLKRFRHLIGCAVFLSAAAFCCGCVAHDADEVKYRRVSAQRVDPSVGEYSFLGLHRDHSPDILRSKRAEHLLDDPKNHPSIKERRAARAMAEAEFELVRKGGLMLASWDGSASKPSAVEYVESPGALTINYQASEQLNAIDGDANALLLVVYHLSDRAALDQLAGHEDGMRKLLEGERFDDSVKRVRTHHVQPGAKGQLLFDRPKGGKFVAIVAGYAKPDSETSLYVAEYGLGRWQTIGETYLHRETTMFMPLPLDINMHLGKHELAAKKSAKWLGHYGKSQELIDSQLVRYFRNAASVGMGDEYLPKGCFTNSN